MGRAKKTIQKKQAKTENQGNKLICDNRKARFNYQLHEKFEAGLMLTGSEVKSLRQGKANLTDAYADIFKNEAFLLQASIEPYEMGAYANHEPKRRRKLLLHKAEIEKLLIKIKTKGMSLVPTKLYFKNGIAKVELALGTGKKTIDKRQTIKDRESQRDMDRINKLTR